MEEVVLPNKQSSNEIVDNSAQILKATQTTVPKGGNFMKSKMLHECDNDEDLRGDDEIAIDVMITVAEITGIPFKELNDFAPTEFLFLAIARGAAEDISKIISRRKEDLTNTSLATH